jgi:hypothetical protein
VGPRSTNCCTPRAAALLRYFNFPPIKKTGALLNTRYEVSNGRPVPIAAPGRSDTAAIESVCNLSQGIGPRVPDKVLEFVQASLLDLNLGDPEIIAEEVLVNIESDT